MPIKEPKYKQLERRIKELAKERRQTETHIRKLEDSLKLWRERLRKAEGEYGNLEKKS